MAWREQASSSILCAVKCSNTVRTEHWTAEVAEMAQTALFAWAPDQTEDKREAHHAAFFKGFGGCKAQLSNGPCGKIILLLLNRAVVPVTM